MWQLLRRVPAESAARFSRQLHRPNDCDFASRRPTAFAMSAALPAAATGFRSPAVGCRRDAAPSDFHRHSPATARSRTTNSAACLEASTSEGRCPHRLRNRPATNKVALHIHMPSAEATTQPAAEASPGTATAAATESEVRAIAAEPYTAAAPWRRRSRRTCRR